MWSTKYPHTPTIYCKVDMYKIDGQDTHEIRNVEICWSLKVLCLNIINKVGEHSLFSTKP